VASKVALVKQWLVASGQWLVNLCHLLYPVYRQSWEKDLNHRGALGFTEEKTGNVLIWVGRCAGGGFRDVVTSKIAPGVLSSDH